MEQLHGDFAAYLHNTYLSELGYTPLDHEANCYKIINEIINHEDAVIDYVYGDIPSINDITPDQLKTFIRSRANTLLASMNIPEMYTITQPNPIAVWFYQGIKSIKIHDFFAASTTQYRKNWKTDNFSRLPYIGGTNV